MAEKNSIVAPARRGRPAKVPVSTPEVKAEKVAAKPTEAVSVPAKTPVQATKVAKVPEVVPVAAKPVQATIAEPIVETLAVPAEQPAQDASAQAPEPIREAPPIITAVQSPAVTAEVQQEGIKMVDVIESTKKYTDDAKVRFQSAFSDISEKAKASMEKSTKIMEEISDLAKGNVEAMVESGKIAAKGVETMGQEAAEYGRISFEKASATMKNFASVKTPAEFFQLQSELLSSSFDTFAKETAKNSEAMLKLVGEVVQPISNRVSIVTDKVKSLAA